MSAQSNTEHLALRQDVRQALAAGVEAEWSAERFDRLARRLFAFQYERNAPYRRFCDAQGVRPEAVTGWLEIPALPTAAFKAAAICSFSPGEAAVEYRTSGTTRAEDRGRHLLRDTALYDASLVPNLQAHLFPDVERIRILALFFEPAAAPHSSLAHMLGAAVTRWGAAGSGFYLRPEGLDLAGLEQLLADAEVAGEPVCLMGTAFAFVHLLDHLAAKGRSFRLAEGSRLMDTGGYKGRSREVPKAELYREYGRRFGLPERHVVNEYGMTEMSSQFYDAVLRDHLAGRTGRRRQKVPPPWVRTQVVDPVSLAPVPPGTAGLLRHVDLANVDSVIALQTEDLGVWLDDGFEVLGRVTGAEPRGCSLALEEVVRWPSGMYP